MPIIKSAKKRVKTAKQATIRNSKTKRSLKSAVKLFQQAVAKGDKKVAAQSHKAAQSALDKAAKKHVLHKNKVARQKRKLAAQAKTAASVTAKAKTATAKAAATKKPAAKKPAAAKPVAKKPAAKPKK